MNEFGTLIERAQLEGKKRRMTKDIAHSAFYKGHDQGKHITFIIV